MREARAFDVIVYGATGFTGRLVAEHMLAKYGVGKDVRWAMAGRSKAKLETVRNEIGAPTELPLVIADAGDPASIATMAKSTKAIITTVGPYQLYGEPMVAACVKAGTDYVDLCGEPAWMAAMIAKYDAKAKASGARIVFSCGFDSIPFDFVVAEPGWTMYMISHFHYDPVWWNTQGAYTSVWTEDPPGRCKQNNAFALVAAHLEMARREPVYKFVLAEVDYLKPYFDAHPSDRADLLRFIAEGRVEVMGGTYNEPNTNLTGPETSIRNFVHGIGFQRDVLGADPATAWQLDVFGHDPQFPGMEVSRSAAIGLTATLTGDGTGPTLMLNGHTQLAVSLLRRAALAMHPETTSHLDRVQITGARLAAELSTGNTETAVRLTHEYVDLIQDHGLEDGDWVVLSSGEAKIYDAQDRPVNREVITTSVSASIPRCLRSLTRAAAG